MALSANTVWEVRTAGSDTNGGGFVTGAAGTDYSQQDNANSGANDKSTTDAVANGTTTLTSATANFGTTIVGNIIYLAGGTGSLAGVWRQVTARASTTSITLDASVAAGTGITMNIGGALASLGGVGAIPGLVNNQIVYMKSGTYTVTSASTNISGGCLSTAVNLLIEGYGSSRGDLGTKPLIQASGISTFTLLSLTSTPGVHNLEFDGASLTSSRALNIRGSAYKCKASNCTNSAFVQSTTAKFVQCEATGCSTASAFLGGTFIDCLAHDNTITGFTTSSAGDMALNCIADTNTGGSTDGFLLSGGSGAFNCSSYGSGRDGFRIDVAGAHVKNCLAEGNSGFGFDIINNRANVFLLNNAGYNNTSGNTNLGTGNFVLNTGFITGSASFFTNAAGGDFTLNTTSGGGASARAAGYPGVFVGSAGTGYPDLGALQHQDSGSAAGLIVHPGMVGGMRG